MNPTAAASRASGPERPEFPRSAWLFPAAAIFPFLALALSAQQGADAWNLRLGDPDNYMRLAQVRDWLAGQAWSDVSQYRINPPKGLDPHWSRLADLPYVVPTAALTLAMPAIIAERVPLIAVPLILLLFTLLAVSRTSVRLGGAKAGWVSCLLVATAPAILTQFVPGRVDHHNLQILLLAAAIAAVCAGNGWKYGLLASLWSSLSLEIGLETAPYIAVLAAWIAVRWIIRGAPVRYSTIGFAAGLAVMTAFIPFILNGPDFWLTPTSDSLGRGHATIILFSGAIFAALVWNAGSAGVRGRLGRALAASLAGLTGVALFPEILSAPYSEVDPLLSRLWLENLVETRSIAASWRFSRVVAVTSVAFVFAGTLVALALAVRNSRWARDNYALLAVMGSVGFVLTCWQIRGASLAQLVVIPAVAAAIAFCWERWRSGGSVAPLALSALLLNPAFPTGVSAALTNAKLRPEEARGAQAPRSISCEGSSDFAGLASLPPGLVISPIDISAMILVRTQHSVFTSSSHRSYLQNRIAYAIFSSTENRARSLVRQIRAQYLVYCPASAEVRNTVDQTPLGFLARLERGEIPSWVQVRREAGNEKVRVFSFFESRRSQRLPR